MKKFLLSLMLLACATINVWADSSGNIGSTSSTYTYDSAKKTLTLTLAAADDVFSAGWFGDWGWGSNAPEEIKSAECVVINGALGETDASKLFIFVSSKLLDLSGVSNLSAVNSKIDPNNPILGVVLPSSIDQATFYSGLTNIYKYRTIFTKDGSNLDAYVYSSGDLNTLMDNDKNTYHHFDNISTINFYNSTGGGVNLDSNVRLAIDQLNRNITTVNAENASASDLYNGSTWEIQNTHIKNLNLSGLTLTDGVTIKVGNSSWTNNMALESINLTGAKITNLDASNQISVENINLSEATIGGTINVAGLDLSKLNITLSDLADVDKIIPKTDSDNNPIDYTSNVTVPTAVEVDVTVAGSSVETNLAAKLAEMDGQPKPKNVTVLHVTGTITKADLTYIKNNLSKMKLLDLSQATFASDVTPDDVANAMLDEWGNGKNNALIVPTPENLDVLTNGADMYVYQQKNLCVGYYHDDIINLYAKDDKILNLIPVLDDNTSIYFLPGYKADGTPNIGDSNYQGYTSPVAGFIENDLSRFHAPSIDFTWMSHSALGYDFSKLNENTHYIVIPQSCSTKDIKSDIVETMSVTVDGATTKSDYVYNENIWVVSTYKSPVQPYAQGTVVAGDFHDFSATGLGALNRTANITYIREPNKLQGAEPYLPANFRTADQITVVGKIGANDLAAIEQMPYAYVDLSKATLVEGADITEYANEHVQYLALPNNTGKEAVDAIYANITTKTDAQLKAMQSFVNTDLAATTNYPAVAAGTLITYSAEAGAITVLQDMVKSKNDTRAINVKNIIMSGQLNAKDICNDASKAVGMVLGSDGHLYATGMLPEGVTAAEDKTGALTGSTILTMDFTKAIFRQPTTEQLEAYKNHCPQYYTDEEKKALVTDMNFAALGYGSASTKLLLPTDPSQKVIPTRFINEESKIYSICIPSNFEYIMDYAFNNLGHKLAHVYTTAAEDDNDLISTVVDNGWANQDENNKLMDYTDSGWTGNEIWGTYTISSNVKYIAVGAFDTNTDSPLKDVYVLAKIAPVCEKDAFCSNKFYGNNGFNNVTPVCRDNYVNGNSWIAVLHYPNALDDEAKKLYTDIDREYFLKDETGAVDGDGNPISWPIHTEFMRSWHQALTGYTWNDWSTNRCMMIGDGRFGEIFAVGGQAKDIPDTQTTIDVENSVWDETKNSYEEGNGKTSYDNVRSNCDECGFASHIGWHQFLLAQPGYFYEKQDVTYRKTPWYSFCVPFDMTLDELKKYLGGKAGQDPEVRTLFGVNRYPKAYTAANGKKTAAHTIEIVISRDLLTHNGGTDVQTFGQTEEKRPSEYIDITRMKNVNGVQVPVYVKGGYPYFVRGWVPSDQPNPENLAAYALGKAQYSEAHLGQVAIISNGAVTAQRFYNGEESGYVAMPYFNHTVDAFDMDAQAYYGVRGVEGDQEYKYNYVGNFDILEDGVDKLESKYIYHMDTNYKAGTSKINRLLTEDSQWMVYKCDISHHGQGEVKKTIISETDTWGSTYPGVLTDDKWGASEFDGQANVVIVFEEDMPEMTDGIKNVGNSIETVNNGVVYNVNGQVVGNSTKNLKKGIYIVNGKKYIVK